ncbi:MAG: hypothetical protein R3B45_08325 [Bdellovibrionota bacterium]
MKHFIAIIALLNLYACSTIEVVESIPLHESELVKFGTCFPKDGGLKLEVSFDSERILQINQLDWISTSKDSWKAQFSDPIGRRLLEIASSGSNISIIGKMKENLPEISVDTDGFLEVNGYKIGLLTSEIPCLLSFTLPIEWTEYVIGKVISEKLTTYDVRINKRAISVRSYDDYNYNSERACSEIKWTSMLGLKTNKIEWCKENISGKKTSTLKNAQGIVLSWREDDY